MDIANLTSDTLSSSCDDVDLAKPLKVSELVLQLKRDVEQRHKAVRVVGEVSSFKKWRSGHCYFDIKDEHALLPAVIFRPHAERVPFDVRDGMLVMFSGRVSIYQANSRLQMIVERMEPLGQGALALAFEQLKERLLSEGLFDQARKKPIKSFNETIGIVTSSHGAVLRDMVRIIKARMPKANILFSPVRVQGAGASAEIAAAITLLDQTECCDVIIVGRGGGSLEDLWPFNEELVARAIFNAQTPIISAVGHETDFSICDFVADLRAATPTHAATIATADEKELCAALLEIQDKLTRRYEARLKNSLITLGEYKRKLKDPRVLLFKHWQRLDEMTKRMHELANARMREANLRTITFKKQLVFHAPIRQLRLKRESLHHCKQFLSRLSPVMKIERAKFHLAQTKRGLHEALDACMRRTQQEFSGHIVKLEALSPLKVLSRGYSVVQSERGAVVSKIAQVELEQTVRIRIEDGVLKATILEKETL